jgi:hypothetical protein
MRPGSRTRTARASIVGDMADLNEPAAEIAVAGGVPIH